MLRQRAMALPKSPRCVITGAGSGFGRALALELSPRKAHLVLSDIDMKGVEETARLATAAGAASVVQARCDVTKVDDWQALVRACGGAPVDLLVNNAGVASSGAVGELSLEDWRWTLDVDLFGVIHGCHAFVPMFRAQGHGHVLNVASSAGFACPPFLGAYNVAKAGVIALSETLATELAGTKVKVTVICPMFFKTNIANSSRATNDHLRKQGQLMVDKGRSAESVARAAIADVDKGRLYSVPMIDGRMIWRFKRAAPAAYNFLVANTLGRGAR